MSNLISIIKNDITFSPYKFYSDFLESVSKYYSIESAIPSFKLVENGDQKIYNSNYRIDPITIPLLLSLFEQLQKFHKFPVELLLYNNIATIELLDFLYGSNFFYLCGDNLNPTYPKGRKIASFNDGFISNLEGKNQRSEHKVRAYSLDDDNLNVSLDSFEKEDDKRDFLISHYTYKVREHFEELLFENQSTLSYHNTYIDILSELITNGVLHSKSQTFALMFVDRFKTKFSISDNGIGFEASMQLKESTFYYTYNDLKSILIDKKISINISVKIIQNLYSIFETLYYSSIKDRKGLFDLMINVVLNSKGYFRLHTENCQVIISNRMMDELVDLETCRKEIYELHDKYLKKSIEDVIYRENLIVLSIQMRNSFIKFFEKAIDKYNSDIKFSSLRFYKVKFRGVHIEVEIPNL